MKLYNGDCLEVMQDIPDNSIDFILTDLPYGTTACKWDNIIPYEPMWEQIKRIRKDNTAIALFGTEPFSTYLRLSNIDEYKYNWIWIKNKSAGFVQAKNMPLRKTENVDIFSNGGIIHKSLAQNNRMFYYPQNLKKVNKIHKRPNTFSNENKNTVIGYRKSHKKEFAIEYENYPNNILKYNNPHNVNSYHPTQKPVALLEYLIKTYTKDNEVVLDFTMGSGSTGVAAINTNRNFIGIELDRKYYNIAKERIDEKLYNNTS
tara:strand:- start:3 stop:782 length:780 start_codon:yes stop_codon:yes gene_type:complete